MGSVEKGGFCSTLNIFSADRLKGTLTQKSCKVCSCCLYFECNECFFDTYRNRIRSSN